MAASKRFDKRCVRVSSILGFRGVCAVGSASLPPLTGFLLPRIAGARSVAGMLERLTCEERFAMPHAYGPAVAAPGGMLCSH